MDTDTTDVIIELSPNEFRTLVYVTKSIFRALSAAKGALKIQIENDTQTQIQCKKTKKDGIKERVLEINGTTHKDVYATRQRIKAMNRSGNEQKPTQPTHFTCIKITNPIIKENFAKFKEQCLTSNEMEPTAFMKPEKLHITFGVMSLLDDESRLQAAQVLSDSHEKIIKTIQNEYEKMEFTVRGTAIMKGSSDKARVLYAKIDSMPLQKIADGIVKSFADAGLGNKSDARNSVKLHMTLINIKYVTRKKVKSFNATHIMEQFGAAEFGCQEVNQILLVKMNEKDPDGFYKRIASLDF